MTSLPLLRILATALTLQQWYPAKAIAASCHKRTVDLRMENDRALVKVGIDGHPVIMILDTGASETVLLREAPDRLGLPPSPNLQAEETFSYGQPLSIHFVRAKTVEFASTVSSAVDLAVLPTTQGNGSASGFFSDPRLQEAEFDLAGGALHLSCPPYPTPHWARQGHATTVRLENVSRVFGSGSVGGAAMRVLFDTGSPISSMTLAAAQRAGISVTGPSDGTASGLAPGSTLRAWTAKVIQVRLGDGDEIEMPILIVDKPHANADMIIGYDFFARHRVWIDRSRHILRYAGSASQR